MASDVLVFTATFPPFTPIAAPVTVDTPLGNSIVTGIEIMVPAGQNGLTGFRLTTGGAQMIPSNVGGWIIASGETLSWSLTRQITTGAWQVTGYNMGQYDHTIYLRFLTDQLADATAPATIPLLSAAAILDTSSGTIAGSVPTASP